MGSKLAAMVIAASTPSQPAAPIQAPRSADQKIRERDAARIRQSSQAAASGGGRGGTLLVGNQLGSSAGTGTTLLGG